MIIKVLFQLFIVYLLYKLIFDFIIPMYKTTRHIREKVNEMQGSMNGQAQQQTSSQKSNATKYTPKKDDYIDFEEVKG